MFNRILFSYHNIILGYGIKEQSKDFNFTFYLYLFTFFVLHISYLHLHSYTCVCRPSNQVTFDFVEFFDCNI